MNVHAPTTVAVANRDETITQHLTNLRALLSTTDTMEGGLRDIIGEYLDADRAQHRRQPDTDTMRACADGIADAAQTMASWLHARAATIDRGDD